MTTAYEVPLSPQPQTFGIAIAGTTYKLTVTWNAINASWMINIADASGNPILSGIPMVTGVDLLEQFQYLGFGFKLFAQSDSDPDVVPSFATLGTTSHLYVSVG